MYQVRKTYISPTTEVAELINENYHLLLFLEHLNIDFTLYDKTVKQVCEENNIDINVFIVLGNLYNGFFPNKKHVNIPLIKDVKKPYISKLTQTLFNTKLGAFLDKFFQKITLKKWTLKFNYLEQEDFDIAMKSTKCVSKHHPKNFQKKVIDQLNENYKKIKKRYNLELAQEHA